MQETALSTLYIFQTRNFLRRRAPLRERSASHPSALSNDREHREERDVLWQLLYANAFIIALDITLLGIQCADLFYIQGSFKPCVYGIKLKIEFVILNRLIAIVKQPASGVYFNMGSEDAAPTVTNTSGHTRGDSLWNKHSNGGTRVEGENSDDTMELNNTNGGMFSVNETLPLGNHTVVYGRAR